MSVGKAGQTDGYDARAFAIPQNPKTEKKGYVEVHVKDNRAVGTDVVVIPEAYTMPPVQLEGGGTAKLDPKVKKEHLLGQLYDDKQLYRVAGGKFVQYAAKNRKVILQNCHEMTFSKTIPYEKYKGATAVQRMQFIIIELTSDESFIGPASDTTSDKSVLLSDDEKKRLAEKAVEVFNGKVPANVAKALGEDNVLEAASKLVKHETKKHNESCFSFLFTRTSPLRKMEATLKTSLAANLDAANPDAANSDAAKSDKKLSNLSSTKPDAANSDAVKPDAAKPDKKLSNLSSTQKYALGQICIKKNGEFDEAKAKEILGLPDADISALKNDVKVLAGRQNMLGAKSLTLEEQRYVLIDKVKGQGKKFEKEDLEQLGYLVIMLGHETGRMIGKEIKEELGITETFDKKPEVIEGMEKAEKEIKAREEQARSEAALAVGAGVAAFFF